MRERRQEAEGAGGRGGIRGKEKIERSCESHKCACALWERHKCACALWEGHKCACVFMFLGVSLHCRPKLGFVPQHLFHRG
jgi:hypothetical protein